MRAIGIILAGGNNNRMRELSNKKSNRGNAYCRKLPRDRLCPQQHGKFTYPEVAVLTQYNARSLNEHLVHLNGGISEENREDFMSLLQPLPEITAYGIRVLQMRSIRT